MRLTEQEDVDIALDELGQPVVEDAANRFPSNMPK